MDIELEKCSQFCNYYKNMLEILREEKQGRVSSREGVTVPGDSWGTSRDSTPSYYCTLDDDVLEIDR